MLKHPATWFILGWLFSLLFSPGVVLGMFSKRGS